MGRTAYDYEEHGLKNIQTYIRNFELPKPDYYGESDWLLAIGKMPYNLATDVNKSHQNTLECRHEKWRFLEHIRQVSFDVISPSKWTSSNFPKVSKASDSTKDPRYELPSVLPHMYARAPIDIENMVPWLSLLLITSCRILHSTIPQMESFAFRPGNNKAKDGHLFRYLIWSHSGFNPHEPKPDSGSVLVAYQPPFILTPSDLKEFTSCKAFPYFDALTTALPSKYRLWAKLWDTCQATQCNWFILTSYTHWVLGGFSKGMRVAFVSPVIAYDKKQPTILEHVLFWLCSASALPGTFRFPQVTRCDVPAKPHVPYTTSSSLATKPSLPCVKVDEPVFADLDINMAPVARVPRPPNSESFWSRRDATPEFSAHADLQSECSLASNWEVPERSQDSATRGGIQRWLATCQNARYKLLDEDDIVFQNLPDHELLGCTVEADGLQGEWMIPS